MKTSLEIKSILKKLQNMNPFSIYLNLWTLAKNIKFYDNSKRLSEAQFSLLSSSVDLLKSGRKPKVTAINQLFLYLVWLRNGFTLQHLSWLFNISIPTASRYLITWTDFLYFKLGNVSIWPTREQVDEYMPESFK